MNSHMIIINLEICEIQVRFKVSISFVIRRTQTADTFKVNADVSSIIKVKEIKKNAARQIDGDVREKMRGRAKIRTNNSNSWKKGF